MLSGVVDALKIVKMLINAQNILTAMCGSVTCIFCLDMFVMLCKSIFLPFTVLTHVVGLYIYCSANIS